ncbi:sensor domain-containing diguanylate cyclase [Antrihabitans sp. YC2-6]|uniref:sensor domain-containing diguanylate cyclase n=1 Tax=Antrihabitans sp. YC2-6 TaxID=2799498 RepID=UPI0018F72AAA|nr:sensor domain-containing diguanylate cyclase [Antrihabitans sp. YC2-6]MBJ8343517.1 GGDEF domain-containing protein [Antrihabitans sp. YC2-6]
MDRNEALDRAISWWSAVADGGLPHPRDAYSVLTDLLRNLSDELDSERFYRFVSPEVRTALANLRVTDPGAFASRSADLLAALPAPNAPGVEFARTTFVKMLNSFGNGTRAPSGDGDIRDSRFRVVFEHAAVAIGIGDSDGRIIDANPALVAMLGKSVDALRGAWASIFVHPDDARQFRHRMADELPDSTGGTIRVEARFRRADGSFGWSLFAITRVVGDSAADSYVLAVGEDVTERRQLQLELERQARVDPLTNLPNRLRLQESLETQISAAADDDRVGLCFLDLDGFKKVNDAHGHATGDRLLADLGARLLECAAESGCTVTRLGGDEFVVLVPAPTDLDNVIAVANHLLELVAEPFDVNGRQLAISGSVGVYVPLAANANLDDLLDKADTALYRAKEHGGGVFEIHTEGSIAP